MEESKPEVRPADPEAKLRLVRGLSAEEIRNRISKPGLAVIEQTPEETRYH